MEHQDMYMLVKDHAVFGEIPEAKRQLLMKCFVALCINTSLKAICNGWGADRIAKLQRECRSNYDTSCADYGHRKALFSEGGGGPAGTMIWEF